MTKMIEVPTKTYTRSKQMAAAVLSGIAAIVALVFGVDLSPDLQTQIIAAVFGGYGVLMAVLRLFTKQPVVFNGDKTPTALLELKRVEKRS